MPERWDERGGPVAAEDGDTLPALHVHLLGGLRVDGVDEHRLGSRKGRRLLAALAASGRPLSSDELAEIVWPEGAPRQPAEQLGVLVSRLRRVIGARRLVRTDAGYELRPDWCDLEELSHRASEASAALDAGRVSAARAAAGAALELAAADVLPAEEGWWVEVPRAQAQASVAAARRVAVDAAVASGDLAAAVTHAEALLATDPLDEPVTRALMLAQARSGRPAAALASYARLRRRLQEDLGVSPSEEVEALHSAILTGDSHQLRRLAASGEPAAAPGDPAFVGRDEELAALDRSLAGLGANTAAVIIEGEPGIGKTSLLDAWIQRVDPAAAAVLRGRCDPLGRDLPLQPVADALHDAVRLHPEILDELDAGDRAQLASSLGVGEGTTSPAHAGVDGTARLYAAIDRLVERLAAGRPVIFALDDLHHAGSSTLSWLAFARRRSRRLLLVGTRHIGFVPLEGATVLRLDVFDIGDVSRLVGEDRAAELHARSGGHPLLLRALLDAGPGDASVTLRDAVDRQLAALGDAAATARDAAVLGPDVDLDLVAAVQQLPATAVLGRLEAAIAVGLLVDDISGLRFRHELVRRELELDVSTARRELLHREAAQRLSLRSGPDWSAVAFHASRGGDVELAADSYRCASAAAERRFDLHAAEAYLDESIATRPSAAAHIDRARVRISRHDLDGAAADAAEAIRRSGGPAALEIAAWASYYRRRYDEARAFADEATTSAPDQTVRISALAVGARVRHGSGDLQGAIAHLEQVGDGPPEVRGVADVWHAHALVHVGDAAGALRLADRALAAGDGLAQPFAPLHGRFARVMALGQLGRPRDALAACTDLDTAIVRFGEQAGRFLTPAGNVRGWVLRNLGRHEEAEEANRAALDASGLDGRPRSHALAEGYWVAMLDLADGALLVGDLDLAAQRVGRCQPVDMWDGTMAWHQRHRLGLLRARLALASGDRASAGAEARAVAAAAAEVGAMRYATLAWAVVVAADPAVDPATVVDDLDRVAGLESWWYAATIASHRSDDAVRHHAERRVAALISKAGGEGDRLRRLASRLLDT